MIRVNKDILASSESATHFIEQIFNYHLEFLDHGATFICEVTSISVTHPQIDNDSADYAPKV